MDDDDDFVDDAMVQAIGNTLRAVGEFMNCGKCDVQFTVVRQSLVLCCPVGVYRIRGKLIHPHS